MIVGLTGGIGCGKSTVLAAFAALDWAIFDADRICRELYDRNDPRIVAALRGRWGDGVFTGDGRIDRQAIADLVFADRNELTWLNGLFHPLVREALNAAAGSKKGMGYILCDVPLLYEAGWERDFDAVIAVWAAPEQQRERLRKRGWSDEEITRRMQCQDDSGKKLERADYGIINNCDINFLQQQCMKLDKIIRKHYGRNE